MRIPDYKKLLDEEGSVTLFADEAPLTVVSPDPKDPDAGPGLDDVDIDAFEAVELQRALTAWLEIHALAHPHWHHRYRAANPGGPWLSQAQIALQSRRLKNAEVALLQALREIRRI